VVVVVVVVVVVGVDYDMRRVFFGDESSTAWMVTELEHDSGDKW